MAKANPRIAVVLSGCGVFDGAEIHESVLTLLAIDRRGAVAECFAPDRPQAHVIDHRTGRPAEETRNVLTEAARIARGRIRDLAELDVAAVDAAIFPGGFGAAKNLCTFAFDGPACAVDPQVERVVRGLAAAGKPIGALCIAPALIARVLTGAEVTIGDDPGTAGAITAMGGVHHVAGRADVVVDRRFRLATSPCYMLDSGIARIADGADAVVEAVIGMIP